MISRLNVIAVSMSILHSNSKYDALCMLFMDSFFRKFCTDINDHQEMRHCLYEEWSKCPDLRVKP